MAAVAAVTPPVSLSAWHVIPIIVTDPVSVLVHKISAAAGSVRGAPVMDPAVVADPVPVRICKISAPAVLIRGALTVNPAVIADPVPVCVDEIMSVPVVCRKCGCSACR